MIAHGMSDRLLVRLGSESHELRIIEAALAALSPAVLPSPLPAASARAPSGASPPPTETPPSGAPADSGALAASIPPVRPVAPAPDPAASERGVRFHMVLTFLIQRGVLPRLFRSNSEYKTFLIKVRPSMEGMAPVLWDELVRRLEVRRDLLKGPGSPAAEALRPSAPGVAPAPEDNIPNDAEALDTQKLARWENAVLGSLYERLYGSTPVRLLGLALAAAVLLAGGGVVFIAGQSYNVHNALAQALTSARDGLQKQVEASQSTITRQTEALKNTSEGFAKLVTEARQEVKDKVNEFRGQSERLKAETSESVVAALKKQLETRTGELSLEIGNAARSVEEKIVAPLLTARNNTTASLDTLQAEVAALRGKAGVHTIALPVIEKQIQQIATVTGQSSLVTTALSRMDEDLKRIDATGKSMFGFVDTARAKESEITQLHKRVTEALRFSDKDLVELAKGIGGAQARLLQFEQWLSAKDDGKREIEQQLEALREPLKELQALVVDARNAGKVIAGMRDEVSRLCHGVQRVEPRRTEPALNQAEWVRVQNALAERGFPIKKIDGNPGKLVQVAAAGKRARPPSETRAAIKLYQASIKAAETGELTGDQIHDLLSLPKSLSCAGLPAPGEVRLGT